jgi:hypothetical protein
VKLQAGSIPYTTATTTGIIAATYQIKASNINGFTTRFGSTFVEFRIIRASMKVNLSSSTNTGSIAMWFDEKSTSAPTSTEANERATVVCPAGCGRPQTMKWVVRDPVDMDYQPIGTLTLALATWKIYTDAAIFGSTGVATVYATVTPTFEVQFRGLQGV